MMTKKKRIICVYIFLMHYNPFIYPFIYKTKTSQESFLYMKKHVISTWEIHASEVNYLLSASVKGGTICFLRDTTPFNTASLLSSFTSNASSTALAACPIATAVESFVRISVTTNKNKSRFFSATTFCNA